MSESITRKLLKKHFYCSITQLRYPWFLTDFVYFLVEIAEWTKPVFNSHNASGCLEDSSVYIELLCWVLACDWLNSSSNSTEAQSKADKIKGLFFWRKHKPVDQSADTVPTAIDYGTDLQQNHYQWKNSWSPYYYWWACAPGRPSPGINTLRRCQTMGWPLLWIIIIPVIFPKTARILMTIAAMGRRIW